MMGNFGARNLPVSGRIVELCAEHSNLALVISFPVLAVGLKKGDYSIAGLHLQHETAAKQPDSGFERLEIGCAA